MTTFNPSSPMMQACLLLLVVGLPALVLLGRTLQKLSLSPQPALAKRTIRSLWRDAHGTATIEFTMVFPILLFLIMLLAQSTLLMGATMVCNHAAFAATRSAVVVIPTNQPDWNEPYNTLSGDSDSRKMRRIHKAAAMALLPVAGRLSSGDDTQADAQALVAGLSQHYTAHEREVPRWVTTLLPERYHYAHANTSVTVMRTRVMSSELALEPVEHPHTFGPRDPVTVRVTHRMNLAVPYVSMIFADGSHATAQGNTYYTNITSQCTLPNEGIVNRLPPRPTLDRRP